MTQTIPARSDATALSLPAEEPLDEKALTRLRRLHLGIDRSPDEPLEEGLLPASLHAFRQARVRSPYPLFVASGEGGTLLVRPLSSLLEETAPAVRVLTDNLVRLERLLRDRLAGQAVPAAAAPAVAGAIEELQASLDLPEAEAAALQAAGEEMVETLPVGGVWLPLGTDTDLELLARVAESRFRRAWEARRPEMQEALSLANRILEGDQERRGGRRPDALSASLGALGNRFLDAEALAGLTGTSRRGHELPEDRRQALEEARDRLAAFLEKTAAPTCATAEPEPLAPEGWTVEPAADPCHRAIVVFDREAERLSHALAAAHRVRLEARGELDPARHDPWLEHLSWEALDREELALLPPIVAVTTSASLQGGGMALLSRLLLSGRPVQVLVRSGADDLDESTEPAAYRFEPGFLGLGYREAFVQQASVARPETLLAGFRAATDSPRAALHVVAGIPSATPGVIDPWLAASALVEGRCEPQFRYDPAAGGSWARRLQLLDDPAAGDDWPFHTIRARRPSGSEEDLHVSYTAADSLLLSPGAASHFFPARGEADALEPLAGWLERDPAAAAARLPFVWACDRGGRLRRMVVSRRLAAATRDRLAFWHTLLELAGIRNEHVEAAARQAREQAQAAAKEEWRRLEERHAEELDAVRRQAAQEAVDRLVTALFELEPGELGPAAAPPSGFAGRSVDELAASLLSLVHGMNGDDEHDAPGDDPRVDELAEALLPLAVALAEEPSPAEEEDRPS